jgi:hypothetical protein
MEQSNRDRILAMLLGDLGRRRLFVLQRAETLDERAPAAARRLPSVLRLWACSE